MPFSIPSIRSPYVWLSALALIAPISFIVAIPWLKNQPDTIVYLFAGLAATVTVLASLALAMLADRKMDDWHRSAARFSSQWGWLTGAGLVSLLLALPPVQDIILGFAATFIDGGVPDKKLVLITFTAGFGATVVTQAICTMLLSAIWRFRMSRAI